MQLHINLLIRIFHLTNTEVKCLLLKLKKESSSELLLEMLYILGQSGPLYILITFKVVGDLSGII